MLLNQSFLLSALPNAKFYCLGVELGRQGLWRFFSSGNEVCASFDSRTIEKGAVFFALKGQTVDGHDFVGKALEKGASAFVVSNLECFYGLDLANRLVILVQDTNIALMELARAWRLSLNCAVIGITGSLGKTSTKEILRSILKYTDIPTYLSTKNQNTLICLCTNILSVMTSCKAVVLEVGIDRPGEMRIKADILRPTIAVITSISYSHIKYFGNLKNVAFEKRQLLKNLGDSGIGIVPGDLPLFRHFCFNHPTAKFGLKTKNNVQARRIKFISDENDKMFTEFTLNWYNQKVVLRLSGIHKGMLNNVLAASTVAYFLHIPIDALKKGIESFSPFENRFEQRTLKDFNGFVISDCYNANPESMRAAISAFDKIKTAAKKIAVIGDMLELGPREVYWHRFVGKLLNRACSIEKVILIGNLVKYAAGMIPDEMVLARVDTWQEAEPILKRVLLESNSFVLVKASHGISLNSLVDNLTR